MIGTYKQTEYELYPTKVAHGIVHILHRGESEDSIESVIHNVDAVFGSGAWKSAQILVEKGSPDSKYEAFLELDPKHYDYDEQESREK